MPESSSDNWKRIKAALTERITRRWSALARLSSETPSESLESRLAAIGDDPDALIALFDDVERRMDRAFAHQSKRAAQTERRGPDPAEFKSK